MVAQPMRILSGSADAGDAATSTAASASTVLIIRRLPVASEYPEMLLDQRLVVSHRLGRPFVHHPAGVEQHDRVGQPARQLGVLLDQQDRQALALEPGDDAAHL